MFSKKAKVLLSTAVLTMLGVAVTGVASARVGGVSEVRDSVANAVRPTHDDGESTTDDLDADSHDDRGPRGRMRAHLEAAASALGITPEALKTALQGGSSLAEVAASKNVAVQNVIDAIIVDERAEITQAVTDGKLTQAEANALLAKVTEHVTAIVNGERPAPLFGHGQGDFGSREFEPRPGDLGLRADRMKGHIEAVAKALGMTAEQLKNAVSNGSTLADVAKSKNVPVQAVIDAIVTEVRSEINQAVTDGKLTRARADEMLSGVVEHVTAVVNGLRPAFGHDHGPDHGRDHGPRGFGKNTSFDA